MAKVLEGGFENLLCSNIFGFSLLTIKHGWGVNPVNRIFYEII